MKLSLSQEKRKLFIKTSLWNSCIEFFKQKKDIDITSYLVSINIKWREIILKSSSPIIKSELNNYKQEISNLFLSKIEKIEFKSYDFDIKFI